MYDVNVSPDKRTILLHDQTRMLDNLKTALTELFESQDYTVPVSQIYTQRQPSYKQLTINSESTASSKAPKRMNVLPDKEELEDDHEASGTVQSTNDVVPLEQTSPAIWNSAPKNSANRDREADNLISRLMDRKAENHSDRTNLSSEAADESELHDLKHDAGDGTLPASEELPASFPRSSLPIPDSGQNTLEEELEEHSSKDTSLDNAESPIPALQSPVKPSSTLPNIFSSSVRRPRAAPEVATITIDSETVTRSIGTPSPKRPRIGSGLGASASRGQSKLSGSKLSSFGSRLTQRFAAPGTVQQSITSEGIDEDKDEVQDAPSSPRYVSSSMEDETVAEDEVETAEPTLSHNGKEEDVQLSHDLEAEDGEEYVDEDEKKAREEAKIEGMIQAAEESAAQPSEENIIRAKALLKGGGRKKDLTLSLVKILDTDPEKISKQLRVLEETLSTYRQTSATDTEQPALDSDRAEEKLSLTISKTDFAKMKIIGQFNLGFILATRSSDPDSESMGDELFIIDQHASDEKYNFERLQAATIVQSQRLVQPKTLDLTALEEEIVIENKSALETNGFIVNVDQSGEAPVGSRCQLVSLPLSRETTFSLKDLDELLALLSEHPSGTVPRPSRVRKMFAMRACRSSIMIGKTLTQQQMGKVVKHLGELDKPWNCPHGRPTMRHLCALAAWDESCWKENSGFEGAQQAGVTDWASYVRKNKR